MRHPQFNDHFPMEEYENRIRRIQEEMPKYGLDGVILSTQQNVDYTSGLLHQTWMPNFGESKQVVIISAEKGTEPILIMPDAIYGCMNTTAISDIRLFSTLTAICSVEDIVKGVHDLGLENGRIGIEISPTERMGFTLPLYEEIRTALQHVTFTDCTDFMYQVRMVKSPREIEKIRFASKVTCAAVLKAMDELHEGMSEAELAHIVALEMARVSGEAFTNRPWFVFVYADGRSPVAWDQLPSGYRFKKGDCIYVDTGYIYHGYGADMIRVASIGEPEPEKAKYYYAARDANMALISWLRPGITGDEVTKYHMDLLRKAGFARNVEIQERYNYIFEGHGIGLGIHEPPTLALGDTTVLKPGMTLSIEGNLFDDLPCSKAKIALKNEENVLITETGCELLSNIPNDIFVR